MAAVTRADFAPILLHRKELRRRDRLEPPVQWMLDMTGSSLFTPLVPGPGTTILDRQNYQRWKVIFGSYKFAHPKRSKRRLIVLQPLAYTSPDYPMAQVETVLLESLAGFCSVYFTGMEVVLDQPPLELSGVKKITKRVHRTTQREQLLVGDVTKYMKSQSQIKSFCLVGITLVDLYPSPNWNFTLGQASFSDGLAVCSFGRHFNSQLDGESPAASDLKKQINNMWVLIKVISHEIGHLFGLTHCFYFNCSMNESSTINEAITQPLFLCPVCLRKLHKVLKFDVCRRYVLLREECSKLLQFIEDALKTDSVSNEDSKPEDTELTMKTSDPIIDGSITDCPTANGDVTNEEEIGQEGRESLCVTEYFKKSIQWLDECIATFNN